MLYAIQHDAHSHSSHMVMPIPTPTEMVLAWQWLREDSHLLAAEALRSVETSIPDSVSGLPHYDRMWDAMEDMICAVLPEFSTALRGYKGSITPDRLSPEAESRMQALRKPSPAPAPDYDPLG